MWSPDRRLFLAGLASGSLALAGCGFEPTYATGGTGDALRGKVQVLEPGSLETYLLVRNLEDRLGRTTMPVYTLSPALSVISQGEAVTQTGSITRYALRGTVTYVLREIGSDAVVSEGTVSAFNSYSARGSTVETVAARRDATQRLMVILADRVTAELYALTDLAE
ncbi:MAG: LPS assembly lipoprotein LptE [Marinibacterium sp.]|nr:LPS assembly lipoprotein LptE [Marinibacterium sp.]